MEKTLEGAKELLNSILLTDNTPILFWELVFHVELRIRRMQWMVAN